MEHIKENLRVVNERIAEAADKSGRVASDITLVGVTKMVTAAEAGELVRLGVTNLGENRPQELVSKYEQVTGCNWHLIGNLQKNKIKYIIDKVVLIQSVESLELAEHINRHAEKNSSVCDILLEVNIANEHSKHGLKVDEVYKTACDLQCLQNVRLRGLMTVAPYVENSELNRDFFKKMFDLLVDINQKIPHNKITILSTGMTGDYATAIEEGATMVRIGTGLFKTKPL